MTTVTKITLLVLAAMMASGCGDKTEDASKAEDAAQAESARNPELASIRSCLKLAAEGLRPIADDRADRFLGKVKEHTARCRGGESALAYRDTPWVDWGYYWATRDGSSRNEKYDRNRLTELLGAGFEAAHIEPNIRGIDGALIDLEYARVELIKFNLFDNYTFEDYVRGSDGVDGPALRKWDAMRLPDDHPEYDAVGGDGPQRCSGELIRHRTVSGICNDIENPLMGSTGTVFARNVQFEETWPDEGRTELTRNRHGDRIGIMKPDPALVSRTLFTRAQTSPESCNFGMGTADHGMDGHCDYKAAPFFNVLAAFWIQFMTHDWFSHLVEGENDRSQPMRQAGCLDDAARASGCRDGDRYEPALVAASDAPPSFEVGGKRHLARAPRTFNNSVTAWWDASQLYGYDEASRTRVKRDPGDRARLLMVGIDSHDGPGADQGYLPRFADRCGAGRSSGCDRIHSAWSGQEATAFPDNWTIGMSFYHNVFAREHNAFVDEFRARGRSNPDADSGLLNPAAPDKVVTYAAITDDELFEAARLVTSAMIAKIHTIEWTTQLLYNEPLFRGMNGNWNGLFGEHELLDRALDRLLVSNFGAAEDVKKQNHWYSVFAAGPGIFGLGSKRYEDKSVFERIVAGQPDIWSITNPDHVNGGVNHFGSPFNFPEEFITVYRLHPLVPDLMEYRDHENPNEIVSMIPAGEGFRARASDLVQQGGLPDWALTMGRQRLGALALRNHAQFLQNLSMPRLGDGARLDIAALDLIRDRERGIPRFNEFRRQYGLRQLTSFDDFIDRSLPANSAARAEQVELVEALREVYGTHTCDATKVISHAQRDGNGNYPNDCLGHPDGTVVDNVEDLDTVVGWLAETTRPHGFAISETQFVVFILNASRRLFSDRFFTSSYRPEFYTSLGHEWVMNNGPDGLRMEKGAPNGTEQPVSPMKRVLQRTVPELRAELDHVVNVFDPWARDRGEYYSVEWKPQERAKDDPAFAR